MIIVIKMSKGVSENAEYLESAFDTQGIDIKEALTVALQTLIEELLNIKVEVTIK